MMYTLLRIRGLSVAALSLFLTTSFASLSLAQETLPFPSKPSDSIAKRTIQDSVYKPSPQVNRLSENNC